MSRAQADAASLPCPGQGLAASVGMHAELVVAAAWVLGGCICRVLGVLGCVRFWGHVTLCRPQRSVLGGSWGCIQLCVNESMSALLQTYVLFRGRAASALHVGMLRMVSTTLNVSQSAVL